MNPYQDRVICSLCGGPGVALAGTGHKVWFGAEFFHKDPRDCKYYLEEKTRELEKREKALEAREK